MTAGGCGCILDLQAAIALLYIPFLLLLLALRLMLWSEEKTPTGFVTRWGFCFTLIAALWLLSGCRLQRRKNTLLPVTSVVGGLSVTGHRGPRHLVPLLPRRRSSVKSRRRRCISLLTDVRRCGRPARRRRFSLCRVAAFTSCRCGSAFPAAVLPGSASGHPAPILIKAAARVGRCALRAAPLDRVGAGRAYQRACASPAGAYVRRNVPSTGPSTARPAAA